MRKAVKRNLIATLALGMVFASGIAISNITADASSNNFAMIEKAGLRLYTDEKDHGIKFVADIGTPVENAKYYMMIVPEKYVTALSLEAGDDYYTEIYNALVSKIGEEKAKETLAVMECVPFQDEEIGASTYVQGTLTQIQYDNLNENWFAIAYYNAGNGNVYAGGGKGFSRDIVYTASKIIALGAEKDKWDVIDDYIYGGINQSLGVTDNPDTEEDERYAEINGTFTLSDSDIMFIEADETQTLTINGLPNVNLYTEWSSSNEEVATVENGVVTAVGNGTATITCKVLDQTMTCLVNLNGNYGDAQNLSYWAGNVSNANGKIKVAQGSSATDTGAAVKGEISSELLKEAYEKGYRYVNYSLETGEYKPSFAAWIGKDDGDTTDTNAYPDTRAVRNYRWVNGDTFLPNVTQTLALEQMMYAENEENAFRFALEVSGGWSNVYDEYYLTVNNFTFLTAEDYFEKALAEKADFGLVENLGAWGGSGVHSNDAYVKIAEGPDKNTKGTAPYGKLNSELLAMAYAKGYKYVDVTFSTGTAADGYYNIQGGVDANADGYADTDLYNIPVAKGGTYSFKASLEDMKYTDTNGDAAFLLTVNSKSGWNGYRLEFYINFTSFTFMTEEEYVNSSFDDRLNVATTNYAEYLDAWTGNLEKANDGYNLKVIKKAEDANKTSPFAGSNAEMSSLLLKAAVEKGYKTLTLKLARNSAYNPWIYICGGKPSGTNDYTQFLSDGATTDYGVSNTTDWSNSRTVTINLADCLAEDGVYKLWFKMGASNANGTYFFVHSAVFSK